MTALPPAPPSAPAGMPPFGPAGWPPEPVKADEPAGLRSQAAVYVVCAVAIGIVSGASSTLEWGVAAMLALAGGVAIALAVDLHRPLGSIPGAAAAVIAMMVTTVVLAFIGPSSTAYGFVPVVGAFVLGLDWRLVRRLRPLPFAFGFLVVIGVAGGDTWTYPAGLLWLVLALGALTSLEADRRAAQPKVEAVTAGPVAPDVATRDLLTTVLIALALALVAALLLSTPSCQPRSGGGSGFGGPGSFGQPGSGQNGSGQPGSGGTGSGGTGSGGSQGSGSGSDHLYVPDPHGRFLVPNAGAGGGAGTGSDGVPSPDLLPEPGGTPRTSTLEDGTQITSERDPGGDGRITVTDAEGNERTYTYHERGDGLIEIQELDEQGQPGRTLYYDPDGKLATDDPAAVGGSSSDQTDPPDEPKDKGESSHLDWRILGLVVAVLAAVGGLVWWLSRRTPKAVPAPGSPPPWALRLAREIEREGAERGPRRARSQSLARYADDLATGSLPDPRLPAVADVVSTALFARHDPGPKAQHWAETTWAEILAGHPAPDRGERRRGKADAPAG